MTVHHHLFKEAMPLIIHISDLTPEAQKALPELQHVLAEAGDLAYQQGYPGEGLAEYRAYVHLVRSGQLDTDLVAHTILDCATRELERDVKTLMAEPSVLARVFRLALILQSIEAVEFGGAEDDNA